MTSLDFPNPDSPVLPGFYPPPVEMWGPDFTDYASLAMSANAAAAHDPTLLLAALGEIEARRAAIEWLLEADLLRLCLV